MTGQFWLTDIQSYLPVFVLLLKNSHFFSNSDFYNLNVKRIRLPWPCSDVIFDIIKRSIIKNSKFVNYIE